MTKKPDIFIVNELNLDFNSDYNITNIEGYNFEIDKLFKSNGIGRTGMWISKNLVYDRDNEIENDNESIVAVKIGYPHKRRFYVIGYYHQWSDTFSNKNCNKLSKTEQEIRLENQLVKFESIKDKEIIFMGDFNINYRIFNKHENDKNNYEKIFSKRIKSVQNHLLGNGFTQLINSDTRTDKIIDHIYSNDLNKIYKSYVEVDT